MKILEAAVSEREAGMTLETYLRKVMGLAPSRVRSLKYIPDALLRNGQPVRVSIRLCAGDRLCVSLPEKPSAFRPADAEAPALSVLYEDEDLLIINKPAGLAVHGRSERGDLTVGAQVARYLGTDTAFHPVNRLDKETSGAMVIARNAQTHERLRRLLHTGDFERRYLAWAEGELTDEGVIRAAIRRESPDSYRRVCEALPESGECQNDASSGQMRAQMAVTRFICLFKAPERSLASILPETGRTHQIRAHFAFIGHPLLGDRLYGSPSALIGRTALHSYSVRLRLPASPDREARTVFVTAPLPDDLLSLFPDLKTDSLFAIMSAE